MRRVRHGRSVLLALFLSTAAYGAAPASSGDDPNWWRNAVIYEVYPRSFADTNGDGIGDLNGITAHLDYLKDLGVDAIWITPFYPSPQVDFGYDISDYRGIDPQFGTMADFDKLMAEAKKRNIRVIGDMVLNHSSDQHPWFIESKSSRTNPKSDWYVWNDGKNGRPPNNWLSLFGGSAWEFVAARKQFYYHQFYKEQPDLNWHNQNVRQAMYDVCRFWMQKGVSGFRLDAITSIFENVGLQDEPYTGGTNAYGDRAVSRVYTDNLPELHDVLRELRKVTDEYPGRILIGETYLKQIGDLMKMYGRNQDELQLPMDLQLGFYNKLSVPAFRDMLRDAETRIGGNVPLFAFENHDNPRSINRYGDGKHNDQIGRLLATLLLTPRDAALIYYGQEIGMVDHPPSSKDQVRDPIGRRGWPKEKGRDGERTPMQWNSGNNAGFSSGPSTWLPVGSDYKTLNVAVQESDPLSMLNYYKKLIELKKSNAQLREGDFIPLDERNNSVLSYLRKTKDGEAVLVNLNFTAQPQTVTLDLAKHGLKSGKGTVLISSFQVSNPSMDLKKISLPPYGAVVGQLKK